LVEAPAVQRKVVAVVKLGEVFRTVALIIESRGTREIKFNSLSVR